MLRKFDRHKMNLRADNNYVYSYETKVAKIDHDAKTVTPYEQYRRRSVTTSKHINYVASELGYEVK